MVVYSNFNKSFILYINTLSGNIRVILHQKGDDKWISYYQIGVFNSNIVSRKV